MVALGQHRGDLDGHEAVIGVMHGGSGTPLSAVRLCGMGVTPKKVVAPLASASSLVHSSQWRKPHGSL